MFYESDVFLWCILFAFSCPGCVRWHNFPVLVDVCCASPVSSLSEIIARTQGAHCPVFASIRTVALSQLRSDWEPLCVYILYMLVWKVTDTPIPTPYSATFTQVRQRGHNGFHCGNARVTANCLMRTKEQNCGVHVIYIWVIVPQTAAVINWRSRWDEIPPDPWGRL